MKSLSFRQWQRVDPRLAVTLTFLAICTVFGGSSRSDVAHLLFVRPAAVIAIGLLLIGNRPRTWSSLRGPIALLGVFAVTMLIQLVPLPPSWWSGMPGHALYAQGAALAGESAVWRPISLTPALTFNAMLALLPACVGLVALAGIDRLRWPSLVPALLVAIGFSAFFGLLQSVGVDFYFFDRVDTGLPIGVFANRNHQALFLATGIPLLAYWVARGPEHKELQILRIGFSAGFSALLILLILLTKSRSGAMVGLLGMASVPLLLPSRKSKLGLWQRLTLLGGGIAIVGLVAVALSLQDTSADRMALSTIQGDMRLAALPTLIQITRDFLPFGTGYGAFDLVYKQYEPLSLLHLSVFNRAHNDPLETIMAGGIPALAVLVMFVAWFGITAFRRLAAWRSGERAALPLLGAVLLLQIIISSIGDYPVRTPLITLIFALAAGFTASAPLARGRDLRLRNR